MAYIAAILIILAFVQGFMIMRKSAKFDRQEHVERIEELIGYVNRGQFDLTDVENRNIMMIGAMSHYFNNDGQPAYIDVVKACVQAGMDVNTPKSDNGEKAIDFALKAKYNKNIVEYLLSQGADVNLRDKRGRTALFFAVKSDFDKYQLIVNRTMNINQQNQDGVTPLMVAARHMKYKVIHDLLDRGGDVSLVQKEGLNAYDIAVKYAGEHRRHVHKSNTDEGTHHDTSGAEEKRINQHNHEISEVIRRLKCIGEGKVYKYKKFKAHGIF